MNSGLNPADPTIVAAFPAALAHQWVIVALIFVLLLVAWGATRAWAGGHGVGAAGSPVPWHEPRARRLLRVGFGILWVFGGIFAPGLTVLFGAPGAVLIYAVAGALIALPERAWESPRTGRLTLAGTGVFLLGMALLQAWPGRGFWQGTAHGQASGLADMVQSMAATSQPRVLSSLVSAFGNFTAAHGFAVNLVAVIALAAIGAAFCVSALRSDARLARVAVLAAAVFRLTPAGAWQQTQVISVPVQLGSSS